MSMAGKRIVFCTFGSLGDLYPVLTLAREMKRRGHSPVIASSPVYRGVVEASGVAFHPVRPEIDVTDPHVLRRAMDRRTARADDASITQATALRTTQRALSIAVCLSVLVVTPNLHAKKVKITVQSDKQTDFTKFKTSAWMKHDAVARPVLALEVMGAVDHNNSSPGD